MTKISLIVPIYKVEKYIRRCIESIISNDSKEIEIILVNDGSPDNCGSICDEYAKQDTRIVVIHKENGGVSSARNAGLEVAKGKYIWFIDADDSIEPKSVNILCERLENNEIDLIIFGYNSIYDKKIYKNDLQIGQSGILKINLISFFYKFYFTYKIGFTPWNKIYKRNIIATNKLKFDTNESFGEDLLFNICYYLHISNVLFSKEVFYNYYIREGSAERTPSKERHQLQMRLFGKIFKYLNQNSIPHNVKNEILPILFCIHLVSGVQQLKQSGGGVNELSKLLKKINKKAFYYETFKGISFLKSMNRWLNLENATFLSRIKYNLFYLFFMLRMHNTAAFLLLV